MKIRNVGNVEQAAQNVRGIDAHGVPADRQLVFRQTMTTAVSRQYETRIHDLVRTIDEQGARLGQRADMKEFARYRQLIRDFMDEVVSNGYAFSKEPSYGARGRHRIFAMVKTVDEKLDALAKEVLEDQADQLSILDKIDDIRGLLLDMFL